MANLYIRVRVSDGYNIQGFVFRNRLAETINAGELIGEPDITPDMIDIEDHIPQEWIDND